jgi:hypothetical protein
LVLLATKKTVPPLVPLHDDASLNRLKLDFIGRLPTEEIVESLLLERSDCLKARPDGTILDGHHRLSSFLPEGWTWMPCQER